jgi:hypothetical protein
MKAFRKFKDFFLSESKKHPKTEAKYVPYPVKKQKCKECTMWRPPNGCSAVEGVISPYGWCKWFKLTKKLKQKAKEEIDN